MLDAVTKASKLATAGHGLEPVGRERGHAAAVSPGRTPTTPTTYAQTAAVADVEVNKKTGKVTVKHVYQAVSAGLTVSLDGVENQIVGGVTQIVSRLLAEQYRYGKTHVTSSDFVSYPILRFKDAPKVTPIVIQWNTLPTLGVGEPVAMVASAAVANAFFDATGVRMRTAPFTPARVRATLAAGGAGTAGIA